MSENCLLKEYTSLDGRIRPTRIVQSVDASFDITVQSTVTHGHGVASKPSKKYPQGTVQLQYPFFKKLGLDIGDCFPGTLNLSINPKRCLIENPAYDFRDVDWFPARGSTENFMFADCAIKVPGGFVQGYVYLPDPATKIENYDREDVIQLIAPKVPSLEDNQVVEVCLKSSQVRII